VGTIDLGQIDLLVREGFYTNRTDFIRNQLRASGEAVTETAARKALVLGTEHYSRSGVFAGRRPQGAHSGTRSGQHRRRCHAGTRTRDDRLGRGARRLPSQSSRQGGAGAANAVSALQPAQWHASTVR
jgi:hypothetical protein